MRKSNCSGKLDGQPVFIYNKGTALAAPSQLTNPVCGTAKASLHPSGRFAADRLISHFLLLHPAPLCHIWWLPWWGGFQAGCCCVCCPVAGRDRRVRDDISITKQNLWGKFFCLRSKLPELRDIVFLITVSPMPRPEPGTQYVRHK